MLVIITINVIIIYVAISSIEMKIMKNREDIERIIKTLPHIKNQETILCIITYILIRFSLIFASVSVDR